MAVLPIWLVTKKSCYVSTDLALYPQILLYLHRYYVMILCLHRSHYASADFVMSPHMLLCIHISRYVSTDLVISK